MANTLSADYLNPFILGTDAEFGRMRRLLRESSFCESTILERAGIPSIYQFEPDLKRAQQPVTFNDRLDCLVGLLMHGHVAGEQEIRRFLEPKDLTVLESLGVIGRVATDPDLCYGTAFVYPVENVWVASDRTFPPLGEKDAQLPADVVFAAITRHTQRFLAAIPRDPCRRLLDLCAGSGIAALIAGGSFATEACAADLGPRCVHFSEFSRRLNGFENVWTAQGDLYGAVDGEKFDRIVAHPPFVPAKENSLLFRDGGQDGEQIFRRIIEELPAHLAEGGRLHCLTFATDRQSGELEERVRGWLGAAQEDFDVVIVAAEVRKRPEGLLDAAKQSSPHLKLGDSGEMLERVGATALFYGSVMVQRKSNGRPAFTARTLKSPRAGYQAAEQYRQMATRLHSMEAGEPLLALKPKVVSAFRLMVTHKPGASGLEPCEYLLRVDQPFIAEANVESGVAAVIHSCSGEKTGSEIFRELSAGGVMSPDSDRMEFSQLLRTLALNGFIAF